METYLLVCTWIGALLAGAASIVFGALLLFWAIEQAVKHLCPRGMYHAICLLVGCALIGPCWEKYCAEGIARFLRELKRARPYIWDDIRERMDAP